MRQLGCLVVLLGVTACSFDDAVPEGAVIDCLSNDECPKELVCSVFLHHCQRRSSDDTLAPTLSATVTPELARPGERVVIDLTASEPLRGEALVEVRAAQGLVSVPHDPLSSSFAFDIPADEPDRLLTFFGTAEDLSGNGAQGVLLGATRVDGTAPTVVLAQLSSSRVAPGLRTFVNVSFSEPVKPGAQLVALHADGTEALRLTDSTGGTSARFELVVTAPVSEVLTLHLEGFVDLAGNAGASTDAGPLTIDADGPLVAAPMVSGTRYSAQPGFNDLAVPVSVTGATLIQVCLGNDCRDAMPTDVVHFAVTAGVDGPRTVLISAQDEVGHRTDVAEAVFFDFSAPQLLDLRVSPRFVNPGGLVAVTATFDEVLEARSRLVVVDGDAGVQLTSATTGDRVLGYSYVPANGQGTRSASLTLEGIRDVVGNALPTLDAGVVSIDADAPVITPTTFPARYSHQPRHDTVAVPVNVQGANRVEVCVDQRCLITDAGVASFGVQLTDLEGPHTVVIRASDEAGNLTVVGSVIQYDFTPPAISNVTRTYKAPQMNCPFTSVTKLGPGGELSLDFSVDEPLVAPPKVNVGGVDAGDATSAGSAWNLPYQVNALAPTATPAVTVLLEDLVGNQSSPSAGVFDIDTTPPGALAGAAKKNFVYRRVPHGAASTSYNAQFQVSAPAGTFPAGTRLQFFTEADLTKALAIGTATVASNGALPTVTLPLSDLATVHFKQYDEACNVDTNLTATAIPSVDVVISFEGKVAGASVPNPHHFYDVFGATTASRLPGEGREWGGTEVARADVNRATIRGPGLRWSAQLGPTLATSLCAGETDADAGVVTAFNVDPSTGRIRRLTFQPPGVWLQDGVPSNLFPGRCGFDATRNALLTLSSSEVYLYDGVEWELQPAAIKPAGNIEGFTVGGGGLWALFSTGGSQMHVWKWNGSWNELIPTSGALPFRQKLSVVYTQSNTLLVVGGIDAASTQLTDTWSFEPAARVWTNLTVGAPIGLNYASVMASASSNADAVLVQGGLASTWELAGGPWAQFANYPGNGGSAPLALMPSALSGVRAIDELMNVHSFKSPSWALVPNVEDPRAWQPTSAQNGTLATDFQRSKVVWHVTNADGGNDRTWLFDGTSWGTAPVPTGAIDSSLLGPATNAVATSDLSASGNGVLLFGGHGFGNRLWRWMGSQWVQVLPSGQLPSARIGHAMTTDFLRQRVVLFGGQTSTTYLNDSWEWNGTSWSSLALTTRPTGRSGHMMAYDIQRRVTVLFGGYNGASLLNDTWEWDGTSWRQVTLTVSPPARSGGSLVWDRTRNLMVLHGGNGLRDTWLYDGKRWVEVSSTVGTPRAMGQAGWDPVTGAVFLHSDLGPAHLLPFGKGGQRLLPEPAALRIPTGAVLTSLSTSFQGTASDCEVFNGRSWDSLGNCATLSTNDPTRIAQFLDGGMQLMPPDGGAFQDQTTDAIEFTVRYEPP